MGYLSNTSFFNPLSMGLFWNLILFRALQGSPKIHDWVYGTCRFIRGGKLRMVHTNL